MRGKVKKLMGISCVILMICLSGCHKESDSEKLKLKEVQQEEKQDKPAKEDVSSKDSEDVIKEMYVHVCGQVQYPGVYRLKTGSRIFEALEAAGGVLETAAAESINQAEEAVDGQRIYVPTQGETVTEPSTQIEQSMQSNDGKVNINTAPKEELMTLNGIGESRADSILKYREEHGSFQNIEELKEIEGIKDGVFNKVKDQVKIS